MKLELGAYPTGKHAALAANEPLGATLAVATSPSYSVGLRRGVGRFGAAWPCPHAGVGPALEFGTYESEM